MRTLIHIRTLVHIYPTTGSMNRRLGQGRKRKTLQRDDRFLRLTVLRSQHCTARMLQKEILAARDVALSTAREGNYRRMRQSMGHSRRINSKNSLCVDYRKLNAVTTSDAYPLPWMPTGRIVSAPWACRQVNVREEDRDKTAFICPFGL